MPRTSSQTVIGEYYALFNHCFRLLHFPLPWKKAKVTTLQKSGKDPTFRSGKPPAQEGQIIPKSHSKDSPEAMRRN
jgi:hypothetical protein